MKNNELTRRFPNASGDFLRLNSDAGQADIQPDGAGEVAVLELNSGDGAVAALPIQKSTGERFRVCVTAIRKRLLDEDNLAEKYHVDLLRYAGVLSTDAPATTKIEVRQEKAGPGEAEEVRIEVWEI